MGILFMVKEPPSDSRFQVEEGAGIEVGHRAFHFQSGLGLSSIWRAIGGEAFGAESTTVHLELEFVVSPPLSASELREVLPKLELTSASFRAGQQFLLKPSHEKALVKACSGRLAQAPAISAIMSSTNAGSTVVRLDVESLKRSLHGATEITLLSAYVDPDLLKALFTGIEGSTKARLRLVFDEREVARRRAEPVPKGEVNAFDRVLKELKDQFRDVDPKVWSPTGGGIFHSKMLMARFAAKTGGQVTAFIGSANATMRGMGQGMDGGNEEILLRLDGSDVPGIQTYADEMVKRSRPLGAPQCPTMSLTEFLLRGTLYFKPTNPLKLTYNPFSDFLAELVPEEKEKISANSELPDAEPGTGLSAFDLERALQALGRMEKETEKRATPVLIKSFAIETCFGYWIPEALVPEFESQLDAPRAAREARLRAILKALAVRRGDPPDPDLMKRYRDYLKRAAEWVNGRGLDSGSVLTRMDEDLGPFESVEGFAGFVRSLAKKLSNKTVLNRWGTAFLAGPMPDLRMDRLVEAVFVESFFEYVAYASQRKTPSKVVQAVLGRARRQAGANLGREPDPADIQNAFVASIREEPWEDTEWPAAEPPKPPKVAPRKANAPRLP